VELQKTEQIYLSIKDKINKTQKCPEVIRVVEPNPSAPSVTPSNPSETPSNPSNETTPAPAKVVNYEWGGTQYESDKTEIYNEVTQWFNSDNKEKGEKNEKKVGSNSSIDDDVTGVCWGEASPPDSSSEGNLSQADQTNLERDGFQTFLGFTSELGYNSEQLQRSNQVFQGSGEHNFLL